jgi:hypothetical protein
MRQTELAQDRVLDSPVSRWIQREGKGREGKGREGKYTVVRM